MRNLSLFAFGVLFGSFGLIDSASAYIDPGTGSLLIQGLIAAVAAGGAAIGLYWRKLIGFFGAASSKGSAEKTPDENEREGS